MKRNDLDRKIFHRFFLFFVILILPIFLIKEYRIITGKKETRISPAQDFFQARLRENSNQSFTCIILTKNNIDMIDENFQSILKQEYPRYQVIYIDRASTDGTSQRLHELIEQQGGEKSIQLIAVEGDDEAFQVYFDSVYALSNDEIVLHLSGNDLLAHGNVLSRLAQTYVNPDVWMTYGRCLDYYSYQKGIDSPKPKRHRFQKRMQHAPWLSASLKTFYAGHFKKVRREESVEDSCRSIKSESLLLFPLAELGKAHVQFIPDVLYIHRPHPKVKKR